MKTNSAAANSVDDYIDASPPNVRPILKKIRATIKAAAPDAEEKISYRIPAYALNGILVYFAAFKRHIGLYPPVRGDDKLKRAVQPYAGEKGNLQFPLDEPIPYKLIERIVKTHRKENLKKSAAKKSKKSIR